MIMLDNKKSAFTYALMGLILLVMVFALIFGLGSESVKQDSQDQSTTTSETKSDTPPTNLQDGNITVSSEPKPIQEGRDNVVAAESLIDGRENNWSKNLREYFRHQPRIDYCNDNGCMLKSQDDPKEPHVWVAMNNMGDIIGLDKMVPGE